ncbi:MAG: hypothetical protein NVS1B7_6970 [Candidatus Saccharimonadales bacterium]
MSSDSFVYDWSKLAFTSKHPVRALHAQFIVAPREMSDARLRALLKTYLLKGNVVVGMAYESHINGFAKQPQFKTLRPTALTKLMHSVNTSASPHKLYLLRYAQADVDYVLEKCCFKGVVLIRGSWQFAFHNRSTYHLLNQLNIPYEIVSPFVDETEARAYERRLKPRIRQSMTLPPAHSQLTETEMLQLAITVSHQSYDYSFQTGAALAIKKGRHYQLITTGYNTVVPYQTFAMLHGSARELHFSPPHDLNHYDTIHAEVALLIAAQKKAVKLSGTSLFINLLPCPTCARMLAMTDIHEIIYQADHSDGYAIYMLEQAGKKVRRQVLQVPPE